MKLTLIRGLPGSGKSTEAKRLHRLNRDWAHFEADQWHTLKGQYRFDPTQVQKAHTYCQLSTEAVLRQGLSVIVSNTFTQGWELNPYHALAKEYGAEVEVITMTGDYGNIHNVPPEVIQKMKERWEA